MKRLGIALGIISIATLPFAAHIVQAASTGPWSVPSWASNIGVSVDQSTGLLVTDNGLVLPNVFASEEVVSEAAALSAETAAEEAGSSLLDSVSSVAGGVLIFFDNPGVTGALIPPTICINATHDDVQSFATKCPTEGTFYMKGSGISIPIKWDFSLTYGESNLQDCSLFGATLQDLPPTQNNTTGSKSFTIPGFSPNVIVKYPYILGCEAKGIGLISNLEMLNISGAIGNIINWIRTGSTVETDVTWSEVIINVAPAPKTTIAPAPTKPAPPAAPVVAFFVSPSIINQGQSSILSWASDNADSCTGSNFVTGGITNGTASVSPSVTTTYWVSCTGPGGTASKNAQITVIPPSVVPVVSSSVCYPQVDLKIQ